MSTEPTTIRDVLESAVPKEEETQSAQPDAIVQQPIGSEPEVEVPVKNEAPEKHRDNQGKFAKSEQGNDQKETPVVAEQAGIKPGPKAEPKPVEKAPVSWRPETREHWAALPTEIKNEVLRREREIQNTLKESTEARKMVEQFNRVIQPYEMLIKAENSNPLQAVDNLMATAARLRTGTSSDVAQMVANIVKQFGVGRFGKAFIEQLDSALVGEIPQEDAQSTQMRNMLQQQLAPVQQFMNQFQQAQYMQQEKLTQEAAGEVQNFLENAEFSEDVRDDMADLMEVAQRRGRELSLQEAYQQACIANPKIRTILQQRGKTADANKLTGAAQKAKAAAVSVSGAPAISAPQRAAVDVRSAIEAAIASHSR